MSKLPSNVNDLPRLCRNQQVRGSSPRVGPSKIKGFGREAAPLFVSGSASWISGLGLAVSALGRPVDRAARQHANQPTPALSNRPGAPSRANIVSKSSPKGQNVTIKRPATEHTGPGRVW